jgi:hypothetical protein
MIKGQRAVAKAYSADVMLFLELVVITFIITKLASVDSAPPGKA